MTPDSPVQLSDGRSGLSATAFIRCDDVSSAASSGVEKISKVLVNYVHLYLLEVRSELAFHATLADPHTTMAWPSSTSPTLAHPSLSLTDPLTPKTKQSHVNIGQDGGSLLRGSRWSVHEDLVCVLKARVEMRVI